MGSNNLILSEPYIMEKKQNPTLYAKDMRKLNRVLLICVKKV